MLRVDAPFSGIYSPVRPCWPHKDGAWHFHGLFSNVNDSEFVDSGKCTDKGQKIFNVGKYKLGFTEAIQLDGSFAVVSYICKYITKKLCEQTKGKKRYWFKF